jgi:16S rRNA (cytidine1402-2'-O)-methyltransferase
MGILYLVATPIGNLQDISARALQILRKASLVAAEDTRHTGRLLTHFQISTRMVSYYEHNKLARLDQVIAALENGNVALVSDAGTPALNDPGYELVQAALAAGHVVSPIPGPSAPLAALVASGLPSDRFVYLGYLPRKAVERRQLLTDVAAYPYTLIFLETPHRLLDALVDIREGLGERKLCVARELTKLHEEIYRGTASSAWAHFSAQGVRGEITLVVAGRSPAAEAWPDERLLAEIQAALAARQSPSQIAGRLSSQANRPRRDVYRLVIASMEKKTNEV